jgi:tRNA (guanine37-N1)-methyltransferase
VKFIVLTLFPEQIIGGLMHSVTKRGIEAGIFSVECINIRDYAVNKHGQVDDYPYGGGAGMVMMCEPVYGAYIKALEFVTPRKVVYLTPQGKPFNQRMAEEFSRQESLILLCGHYEGVDERVIEEIVTDEVSVGDFVLTGGEIAAMAVIDATARLLPGLLGNDGSNKDESFANDLLEYPQYTRPARFMAKDVPEVLISGHHGNVAKWRREQSALRTALKRPDMIGKGDGI